jgi:hypothetical protein
MPPLADVPDVLRITIGSKVGNDVDVINNVHFQCVSPLDVVTCEAIATAFAGAWGTHMAPLMHTSQELTSVTVTDLVSSTGAVYELAPALPGTDSGSPMPAETAMIVKFIVSRRYRGGHPKIFLSGFPDTGTTVPQLWPVPLTTSVLAAWTEIVIATTAAIPPPSAGAPEQVSVSYYLGFTNHLELSGRYRAIPTPRATPFIDIITGYEINPKFASQRRRSLQSL